MKVKKVIAVTGARSEYDILYPLLDCIEKDHDLELSLVVTGSHLSKVFGHTVDLIEKDGFKICARIDNLVDSDDKVSRIISLGNQIAPLASVLDREKPDLVIVVGDREEAITVTMTCAYMDIAVAHIAGGDIAKDGNIDNSVRYAASKFAHLHFTILPQHKDTLLKLGEDEWRIHVTGNPALDRFIDTPRLSRNEISDSLKTKLVLEPYLVLIQHPIITEVNETDKKIRATLDAIVRSGMNCLINYPNSDAGNKSIRDAYDEYWHLHPQLFLFKNLDRTTYINVLRHCSCLLGNSSSGIIEAPSIHLPVVNIGSRQRGRIQAGNVIFVDNNADDIYEAIQKSITDKDYIAHIQSLNNPYGDGKSAVKILEVIKNIRLTQELIYKNITY